ncbi:hypothetical protein EPN83_00045 [Patescibacteria group bacterium]|nr:MAG: hypothetical protein EPN83_00045 [Patescibacteria group bacterium]
MAIQGKNKNLLVLLALLIILATAVYFLLFRKQEEEPLTDELGNPIQAQVVGQDLIGLLSELEAVKFDTSLFRSPAFLNLADFGVSLVSQAQGRINPFDVIGRGSQTSSAGK